MNALYQQNYWGGLSQFELPHCVIQNDTLILPPSALAILLILYEEGHAKHTTTSVDSPMEVLVDQKEMMELSGYSKDIITEAIQKLEVKNFVRSNSTREKDGQFSSKSYALCNPADGLSLKTP